MANADGRVPASLVAWLALGGVLFVVAPPPPSDPGMTAEEIAAMQRTTDFVVRDVLAWQAEFGDRTIPWTQAKGHLAIVIDDIGRELHIFEKMVSLPYPLTFSVLPGSVYTAGVQLRLREDRRRYREIALHLPMEPSDAAQMQAGAEAREVFLRAGDDPQTLREKTAEALRRVPTAVVVNNHMGSALTTDRDAMQAVMAELARTDRMFLDSRTTAETVAEATARELGVMSGARHVFLDDDPDPAAIARRLAEAAERATTHPTIAIGHPSIATYEVLRRELDRLHAAGIGVYPLSQVLRAGSAAQGSTGPNTGAP